MSDMPAGKPLKGRHVLYWLGGFFGLMFIANGIFLYVATTTFPGEDVEKSYLQGLDYNRTLEARAAQADLGWTLEAGFLEGREPGKVPQVLVLDVRDRDGATVSGLNVRAEFRRKATTADDMTVQLASVEAGTYASPELSLCEGLWEVRILAEGPQGQRVTARKDLVNGRSREVSGDDAPARCPEVRPDEQR